MKLYSFAWGYYPRRVLIYLAEKGLKDIEIVEFDVLAGEHRTAAFLEKNPRGTLPMLEVDSGRHICQSNAIIQFFEEIAPEPNLMGQTLWDRTRCREQLSALQDAYLACTLYSYQASPLMADRRPQTPEAAEALWSEYSLSMATFESFAGDGPFLGGEAPNLADVLFFASAQFYELMYRIGIPESCPTLRRIYANFAARPSAAAPQFPAMILEKAPIPRPAAG